jgi:hypothetical protein
MITADDVPALVKKHAPRFSRLIDEYVEDLGDAVNYPMLWQVIGTLLDEWRTEENATAALSDLQHLLNLTEDCLHAGDSSVHDLFALEVVEPLMQPENASALPLLRMGPATLAEMERARNA